MTHRVLYFIWLPFIVLACGGNEPNEQKEHLNGYWQIEQVDSPYGEDREYQINERVDYIEVDNDTGFRAKVVPRLDGSIIHNGTTEKIKLSTENDSLRLYYTTNYDQWTETVLQADAENLKVKNDRGIIYTYSRYELIDLTEELKE